VEGHDSTLEKTKEMNLNFKRRQGDDDTVDREKEDKRHKPNLHPSMMSELDVPLHDSTLEKTKEMNLNFKRRQADDYTVDRERENKRHKPNNIFTENIEHSIIPQQPLHPSMMSELDVLLRDSTLEKTKKMNLNFKRRQADDDTADREREDKRHKPNNIFTDNIENSIMPQQPLHPSMMSELDVPLHDMTDMRNVDSDDAEPVNVIVFPALIVDQLTTQYNIPVLTPPVFPVIYSPMMARL
jgi:hypothetical protein